MTVHSHPCNSSAAAAALAPPQPLSYWYGTSLATVREVAATGKLCLMSLDAQGAQVGALLGFDKADLVAGMATCAAGRTKDHL